MAAEGRGPDGLAVVDKPPGWTSHDVVARARRILGTRRVGHSGTLDPSATGVLLLGVGKVTRLLRFLGSHPKSYTGELLLGIETSTLDAAGEVVATHDMSSVTLSQVRAVAARFVGEIEQVPPMVSAVKVGGRRLHELARRGIEVERAARRVMVHELEINPIDEAGGRYGISVRCSSGTYVRVLAADIGKGLGGGAHLRALRRVAIGPFTVEQAVRLEALTVESLLPPAAALAGYPPVTVEGAVAAEVAHGKVLPAGVLGVQGDGPWPVLDTAGSLLAVYEAYRDGHVKPAVVLAGS